MKLRQNAKELVLLQIDGMGTIIGEIRYNKQTETAIFTLEKSAFFDLYFPCVLMYDQRQGTVVRPHILSVITASTIRIQRTKVSCFVLGDEISSEIVEQYYNILKSFGLMEEQEETRPIRPTPPDDDGKGGDNGPKGSPRIITLSDKRKK